MRPLLRRSTRTRLSSDRLRRELRRSERQKNVGPGFVHLRWEAVVVAVFLVVAGGLPFIARCEDMNPYSGDPEAAEDGRTLYFGSGCVQCHGPIGEGAVGPSLVDYKWLYWCSPGTVYRAIRNGRKGTRMIAYKEQLTEDETWKVVEFLLASARENKRNQNQGQ